MAPIKLWRALLHPVCVIFFASICHASDMTLSDIDNSRKIMIERQLKGRNIVDPAVLKAMESVPREKFVSQSMVTRAYNDSPLPIGEGQTISQPYIVALMTQLLKLEKSDKVLEVGTGSGYQAAVLAEIAGYVYTIEIVKPLAEGARSLLNELKYENIVVSQGDGYKGWMEHSPFDKIIVTAAAGVVPAPLEDQLKEGGRLVMPVGGAGYQKLLLGVKENGVMKYETVTSVRFVPMTGMVESK
ncbi:Protein-L-isoaspartate O-methyltransferase [hydrothermal vent metagenome]|uniref:protein-L-isoaspartate(D-aspartate) O-methyltransferase n=1 Tax=hydrothermal vent metagenome TaxID=652676 RepID=A0A3B1CBQ2_9ZZZZ